MSVGGGWLACWLAGWVGGCVGAGAVECYYCISTALHRECRLVVVGWLVGWLGGWMGAWVPVRWSATTASPQNHIMSVGGWVGVWLVGWLVGCLAVE